MGSYIKDLPPCAKYVSYVVNAPTQVGCYLYFVQK